MEDKQILVCARLFSCVTLRVDGCNACRWPYCLVNILVIYMKRIIPLAMMHLFIMLFFALFLGVQSLKYFSVDAPNWIYHYLNDFLTIPLVASLCLHTVWIIKKDNTLRLSIFTILSLVILFSVYFEYYLPKQSHRYTGDFLDVMCYISGGIFFYILQKIEVFPFKNMRSKSISGGSDI